MQKIVSLGMCLVLAGAAQLLAEDWPSWRGINRDGISPEKGLAKRWPASGPKLKWTAEGLGRGFSTPSVAGGKIYLIGDQDGDELLYCVDAKGGSVAWSQKIGKKAAVGYDGSRATPTIDGNMVYALSSNGELAAIDTSSQKVVWQKSYKDEFGGRYGAWGFAESPLVDRDRLIIGPGGPEAGIVALNKMTGETLWKSKLPGDPAAAYASPIVIEVGKVRQYVHFLSKAVVGVDAESGKQLWSYENCSNGTANCPTPVYSKGQLFAASGYGTGGGSVSLKASGGKVTATEKYFVPKFVNHHGGFVKVGDYVYGSNEQTLLCMDWNTGNIKWQARQVGKGSIIAADGKLYCRNENGTIVLVNADPSAYVELGRIKTQPSRSSNPAWPHPVISDKTLYIRDWDKLLAFDIKG